MGPRSDERGNHRAEKAEAEVADLASMGPRSDERGNIAAGTLTATVVPASMGPRSDERGNCFFSPQP